MKKNKIGIYCTASINNSNFTRENKMSFGFQCIINEIDLEKYTVDFCNIKDYNKFDILLYSVTSFYDILALYRDFFNLKSKPILICGGPDISNIHLLSYVADVVCLGRCEDQINDILEFKKMNNVWYKKYDPEIKNKYNLRQPTKLLQYKSKKEVNVGCNKKCLFCQYSFKFKLFNPDINYNSCTSANECFFSDISIMKDTQRITTGIDGITQEIRYKNNKYISDFNIFDSFTKYEYQNFKKLLYVKLYMIIGFPGEYYNIYDFLRFFGLFKMIDSFCSRNNILIDLFFNHFIPMPLTPYEYSSFNFTDFRTQFFSDFNNIIFTGKNITLRVSYSFPGSCYAADRLYLYRVNEPEDHIFEMIKSKYWIEKNTKKIKYYENNKLLYNIQSIPSDNIIIPNIKTPPKHTKNKTVLNNSYN